MDQEVYQVNDPDCTILNNWIFDGLILTNHLLAKDLQGFATCLSVNNNLFGKLVLSSESPIILGDSLKITSIWVFTAVFNLLSSEFNSFKFRWLYWVISWRCYVNPN